MGRVERFGRHRGPSRHVVVVWEIDGWGAEFRRQWISSRRTKIERIGAAPIATERVAGGVAGRGEGVMKRRSRGRVDGIVLIHVGQIVPPRGGYLYPSMPAGSGAEVRVVTHFDFVRSIGQQIDTASHRQR